MKEGVHIALIQETNLSPEGPLNSARLTEIPGDWTMDHPSVGVTPSNRGKGIAVLISPDLTSSSPGGNTPILKRVMEHVCDSFEVLATSILNIIVVNIYVHASVSPDYNVLYDVLASIPGVHNSNVVVGGDFNHPKKYHHLVNEVMAPLGLEPSHDVDNPTPTRGNNTLDMIFWKGIDITVSQPTVKPQCISDHQMVMVDVSGTQIASLVTPAEPPILIKWDLCPPMPFDSLSDEEQEKWRPFVNECDAVLKTACDHHSDPLTAMTEALMEVAARHLGTKEYHIKSRVPWWNHHLAKLHRSMRRLHKRRTLPNIPASRRARYESQYQSTTAKYKRVKDAAVRKCRNDYAAKYHPRDMNRTWKATERARGKRDPRYIRRVANGDGDSVEYWSGMFLESRFDRPDPPAPLPLSDSGERLVPSVSDMREAMTATNDSAPGADGFRAKFLHFLRSSPCAKSIMKGVNRACHLTISPQAKSSVTVLIRKPRTTGSQPSNYRPIALQPVVTKLVSKCIEQRIWKLIDDKVIELPDSQAGFRPGRSRYDLILLLRCAQDHYHPWKRRGFPKPPSRRLYSVFLDITKAYDSVPHIKIVERLRDAGIPEYLIRIIVDLLSNRTTTIYGRSIPVGRGVPQGDPLSPLLFILFLHPLSKKLEECGVKGAELPGGLILRDLEYADDINLMSETAEGMNTMLDVCVDWAGIEGLEFSVEKSKAMVLAGPTQEDLPQIMLGSSPLEWVKSFNYLGCTIMAYNKVYKYDPSKSINKAVMPVIPALHYGNMSNLPLIHRARALVVLAEGRALHNAQVMDLNPNSINSYINKGLRAISGLTDTTLLRCDLGIMPAELTIHRNCMYFLWHIHRNAWFSKYLPDMQHLYPVRRITSMTLQYDDIQLDMLNSDSREQWRNRVRKAINKKATTFYNVSRHQDMAMYPNRTYEFRKGGQRYLSNPDTMDLAQAALELRQHRLPVARDLMPRDHHPCPFCGREGSMNGHHLLQCHYIPDELNRERENIMRECYPTFSLESFALGTVSGFGAHVRQAGNCHYSTVSWRKSVILGRKIAWAARSALRALLVENVTTTPSFDQVLQQLFQEDFLPLEEEAGVHVLPSEPRVVNSITEGGLSAMAYELL